MVIIIIGLVVEVVQVGAIQQVVMVEQVVEEAVLLVLVVELVEQVVELLLIQELMEVHLFSVQVVMQELILVAVAEVVM
jgi:hypothetical protein